MLLVNLLSKWETLNSESRAMTRVGTKSCGTNSNYFQFFCTLNILLAPPNAPLDVDFSMWVPEKLY
jgi:hypothetical protein